MWREMAIEFHIGNNIGVALPAADRAITHRAILVVQIDRSVCFRVLHSQQQCVCGLIVWQMPKPRWKTYETTWFDHRNKKKKNRAIAFDIFRLTQAITIFGWRLSAHSAVAHITVLKDWKRMSGRDGMMWWRICTAYHSANAWWKGTKKGRVGIFFALPSHSTSSSLKFLHDFFVFVFCFIFYWFTVDVDKLHAVVSNRATSVFICNSVSHDFADTPTQWRWLWRPRKATTFSSNNSMLLSNTMSKWKMNTIWP